MAIWVLNAFTKPPRGDDQKKILESKRLPVKVALADGLAVVKYEGAAR